MNYTFSETQLNRLFPFYLKTNKHLSLISIGASCKKLFNLKENDYLHNHFFVLRPFFDLSNSDEVVNFCNQLILLEHKKTGIKFRGQFECFKDSQTLLFIGSPWFTSMEEVIENNLVINDFAQHDPLIDLLHVLKTQEIGNADLKKLLNKIHDQKVALDLKNKEVHDIALFPMQNPDPLIRINFNGEILKNNPAAALLDFFEFENKQYRIDKFLKFVAKQINQSTNKFIIEANSNNLTYSLMCVPMPNEGYINIYGRNITDRKIIEVELEKQRKFYEDVLNNMPADIAVFNKQHQYLFVNPKAIKNEETRKWIIGKTDADYCIEKQKPLTIAINRSNLFNRVITEKIALEWEETKKSNDGENEIILRRWFPVLDENKNVSLVIGYGIDITERKKSEEAIKINEEKYRNIIANMNLGLMEIDKNGLIEFVNQRIQKMTGLSKSEMVGKNPEIFLAHNDDLDKKNPNITTDAYEIETLINGKQAWWLVSAAPQFTTNGKLKGNIIICLDISKQKKLEKELIHAREVAEQLAKTKETFLANMSHEIRTPMNAIMGIGSQLAKTSLTDKQSFFVKTINSASENLLYIINDILDLSKIEAGKLTIEHIGFNLKKTLQDSLQMQMYKAEEKGLMLAISHYDTNIAEVLIGDPYRLNQIILNLISNAIKFTEKGEVKTKVELIEDSKIEQKIKISVIDSGIGMDSNFIDVLFDKFSQEYSSVSRKYGGTGLGMSICKELIALLGGEIKVESKKQLGTTVSFVLNYKIGTKEDLPEAENLNSEYKFLEYKKIIIADDNEMNRLVARTILETYNIEVYEATNGNEVILKTKEVNPDLILMDVQMPFLNGYEATKSLRKLGINIPIIALTANVVKGEKENCIDAGMNEFISKPFKEEDLINCIIKNIQKNKETNRVIDNTNKLPLYDLSSLKMLSKGNNAFVEKMITLFLDIAPKTVSEINEALANNEVEKVNKLAHRLKPSIDNLSIFSLKELIRKIEAFNASATSFNNLKTMVDDLNLKMDEVVYALKKEL